MEDSEIEKKEYEVSFLIRDEGATPEVLKVFQQHGAEVNYEGQFRRIALAYPVGKASHASFGYCHVAMEPGRVAELEKDLEMQEEVLRFLITTPPFKRSKRPMVRDRGESVAPAEHETAPPQRREPLPLSNEELEKKIGEILQ